MCNATLRNLSSFYVSQKFILLRDSRRGSLKFNVERDLQRSETYLFFRVSGTCGRVSKNIRYFLQITTYICTYIETGLICAHVGKLYAIGEPIVPQVVKSATTLTSFHAYLKSRFVLRVVDPHCCELVNSEEAESIVIIAASISGNAHHARMSEE